MNYVDWDRETLKTVQSYPEDIKKELGYLIYQLQVGHSLAMPYSRPMPTIGSGCHELRVRGSDGTYRAFYVLKIKGRVIIFHTFKKKTQKTSKKEIDLGKKKLKEKLDEQG